MYTEIYNRKICSKMITSIIRYHTAIHYIMLITRDRFRPYWVSSGGCKKHSIINMLKKTNLPLGAKKKKNAMQNFVLHLHLHLHLYLHCICICICICIAFAFVLHCIFLFFLHPMANLFFLAYLLLSVFYTRLMRPNKVETSRGLLT